jgi:TolB-like protein
VLPLNNLSGDPSQEYFADGMTEALIANLAHIRAVRVVSRTSVMRFKGAARSLPEIARTLEVDAIVEGSVQRSGARVRINVQLVHAPTDTHLWARQYERELTDVLKLQADVARAVVDEIQVQITAEERARLASAASSNAGAYQEYLLGQHYLWTAQRGRPGAGHLALRRSDSPGSRLRRGARRTVACVVVARASGARKTLKQVEGPSRAAARTALQLDGELAEGARVDGTDHVRPTTGTGRRPDISAARSRSIRTSRTRIFFHGMLSMALGRFDEADRPHGTSGAGRSAVGDGAVGLWTGALSRPPLRPSRSCTLNNAIELEPQTPEAISGLPTCTRKWEGRRGARSPWQGRHVAGATAGASLADRPDLRADGQAEEARRILRTPRTTKWPLMESATVYAALGDKDEAFRSLSRMFEERDGLNFVKTDPRFDACTRIPDGRPCCAG